MQMVVGLFWVEISLILDRRYMNNEDPSLFYEGLEMKSPSTSRVMSLHLRTQAGKRPFFPFLWLYNRKKSNLSQTLKPTLIKMVTNTFSRRSMCPSCSKPSRICLCIRIQTPSLNNSVGITILQHSLEQNHPLNSTRIATLGLKNLNVVSVSDVNFEAQFAIWPLNSNSEMGSYGSQVKINGSCFDYQETQNGDGYSSQFGSGLVTFTIRKSGVVSSFKHHWMLESQFQNPNNFDQFLTSSVVLDALSNGFVVKKWQNKQLSNGCVKTEETEEFGIMVPPGSALLFPSENAVGIEEIGFEVKNLIVLDGTWAKAKRVYNENPWLKVMPHLKLDLDKMSLYGEVRTQPRAGCLSTIESIVYALKELGEKSDGLDNLLDVFESMVGDQRRCMNERLSKISLS